MHLIKEYGGNVMYVGMNGNQRFQIEHVIIVDVLFVKENLQKKSILKI